MKKKQAKMKYVNRLEENAHKTRAYKWLFNWVKKDIENKNVLDIGCWSGVFEKLFYKQNCHIVGIDVDEAPLREARKAMPNFTFKKASIVERMPFKRNTFDTVLFLMTLEHIPKNTEIKALKNINLVLKKGGVLYLSTMNHHLLLNFLDPAYIFGHRHYKLSELEKMIKNAGFKIIESRTNGDLIVYFSALLLYAYKYLLHKPFFNEYLDKAMYKEFNRKGRTEIKIKAIKIHEL